MDKRVILSIVDKIEQETKEEYAKYHNSSLSEYYRGKLASISSIKKEILNFTYVSKSP